jgi:hypothetical protein
MGFLNANVLSIDAAPKGLGERLAALLRGAKNSGTPALRHVETLSLGPRRSLYLVECDGERFLIAAGEGLSAPVPLTQQFVVRPPDGQQR